MFDRAVGVLLAGVLGGVVFYLHAIQSGGFYPFLWPILAGAAAVRLAEHHRPAELPGARAVMGSLTGCTAAITFLALGLTPSPVVDGVKVPWESIPRPPGELLNTILTTLVFIPSGALGALLMRNPRPICADGSNPSRSAG